MKAKFGKLSILCFIIPTIHFCVFIHNYKDVHDGSIFSFICTVYLCMPIGLLFGYLSVLKQEIPKCYRYVGFFLNLALFLLPLFIFLRLILY